MFGGEAATPRNKSSTDYSSYKLKQVAKKQTNQRLSGKQTRVSQTNGNGKKTANKIREKHPLPDHSYLAELNESS